MQIVLSWRNFLFRCWVLGLKSHAPSPNQKKAIETECKDEWQRNCTTSDITEKSLNWRNTQPIRIKIQIDNGLVISRKLTWKKQQQQKIRHYVKEENVIASPEFYSYLNISQEWRKSEDISRYTMRAYENQNSFLLRGIESRWVEDNPSCTQ